jgi:hypothetical protein
MLFILVIVPSSRGPVEAEHQTYRPRIIEYTLKRCGQAILKVKSVASKDRIELSPTLLTGGLLTPPLHLTG